VKASVIRDEDHARESMIMRRWTWVKTRRWLEFERHHLANFLLFSYGIHARRPLMRCWLGYSGWRWQVLNTVLRFANRIFIERLTPNSVA
jgi:hypothetical protein